MPNIFEAVQDLTLSTKKNIPVKNKQELELSASSSKGSARFRFVPIDLTKLPMLSAGVDDDGQLVIDLNTDRLRQTKSGFIPKLLVVSGLNKLRTLKRAGELTCSAWVGDKVLAKMPIVSDPTINVKAILASNLMESLLDTPNVAAPALGARNGIATNWTEGGILTHFGAPGSEVNNSMLKLMLNVEDALSMYETEKAEGIHKVIHSPYAAMPPGLINAGKEAKIAASSVGLDLETFSVMDFLKWQNTKMSMKASAKTKNGLRLDAFAYVGDDDDISTWQLQCNSQESIKDSLKSIAAGKAMVPKNSILEAKMKLKKLKAGVMPEPAVSTEYAPPSISSKAKVCMECGKSPCVCRKGGPHLGKGKSATKAKKEMDSKRKK